MREGYILGGGGGPDLDVITAGENDILNGKTGIDNEGNPVNGNIPVNPTQNASLNCGQSKVIPAGYTPGGTVTANSLASQTGGATADDTKVLSGYKYWRDGVLRTGNLTVQSVVSFSVAQYSSLTIIASWAKPSKGPWSGLRIMCKQGSYPTNAWDGTLFYEGSGTWGTKQLAAGIWYFTAWNYLETSAGRLYNNSYVHGSANNASVSGQQIFTQSGTFNVPAAVRQIQVFVVGGGGAGGSAVSNSGGGGGGGYTNHGTFAVSPGQQFWVGIGAGGAQTTGNHNPGSATSFGALISAAGGAGGMEYNGGTGGSGGGQRGSQDNKYAGNGGNDGSNGALGNQKYWGVNDQTYTGATGQGRTTRAFGEASGTLYAGGGGGGNSNTSYGGLGGKGGGGNGAYCNSASAPVAGTPNTGGGGGGARYRGDDESWSGTRIGAAGGSGICIVRW